MIRRWQKHRKDVDLWSRDVALGRTQLQREQHRLDVTNAMLWILLISRVCFEGVQRENSSRPTPCNTQGSLSPALLLRILRDMTSQNAHK
jgi:hypothetical protein